MQSKFIKPQKGDNLLDSSNSLQHSSFYAHHGHNNSSVYNNGNISQQKSTSLNQRFSANFASSSDIYGTAHRSRLKVHNNHLGNSNNDSGSRYFGKSKFSLNSQKASKNFNSVLNQIKEAALQPPADPHLHSFAPCHLPKDQHLDQFERKYSLSTLRGNKQLESHNNKMLKNQNI